MQGISTNDPVEGWRQLEKVFFFSAAGLTDTKWVCC